MTKQEINELKKLLNIKKATITRICGCYVDGDKNKKAEFKQAFHALPEEDMFKYLEIFKKVYSGSLGKNLLNLEFPLKAEEPGAPQDFLMRLKASALKDDTLLEAFYDQVIANYEYVGNYLILLIHDAIDVPGITRDGLEMEDASDEVYEYVLCAICPVELSKPGLSYDPETNSFHNRERDWVVVLPETGFLFPAFNDRSTDIHALLYYSKDAEELRENFVDQLFGCTLPLSAGGQKETFQTLIEETLGDTCELGVVKNIHDKLHEMVEEHKEEPAPLILDKHEVKAILADSGVSNDRLEEFDRYYDTAAGEKTELYANNVFNTRSFDVKTPDVVIKVKPERTDLIEDRRLDGRSCIVAWLDGSVEVNGIIVRAGTPAAEE